MAPELLEAHAERCATEAFAGGAASPAPRAPRPRAASTASAPSAPAETIWTEPSDDPETPLVVTFINKVRRRKSRPPSSPNPSQPRPKTPPPKKRPPPRAKARRGRGPPGDAEVLTVHAGITVELRDVAAANPAMVPAVEAADERLRRLPESALVFTNGRGEPDFRKNVEWQRLVAEEDALLRTYAGKRRKKPPPGGPAGKRARAAAPPPRPGPRGSEPRRKRTPGGAELLRRLADAARLPRGAYAAADGRCRLLARVAYKAELDVDQPPRPRPPKPVVRAPAPAAPAPAPAPAPQSENAAAREYIGRMQHVHRLDASVIARFASELKDYQDGRGDKDAIVRRVHGLLAGYPDLIRDFYNFLPPGDRAAARAAVDRPPPGARGPYGQQPAAPPIYRPPPAAPPPAAALMPPVVQGRPPPARAAPPPPVDYLAAPARPASVPTAFFGAHENGARDIGWAVPSTVMLAPAHAQAIAAIAAAARPARWARPPPAAPAPPPYAAFAPPPGPRPRGRPPGSGRRQQAAQRAVAMAAWQAYGTGPPPPAAAFSPPPRRPAAPPRLEMPRGPGGAVDAAVRTLGDRLAAMLRVFAAPPRAAVDARDRPLARDVSELAKTAAAALVAFPRDAATFALFADVAAKAAVALATNAAADDDLVAALAAFGAAAGAAATPLLARVIGLLPDATTVQSRVYVARMRKPTALAEVADAQDLLFADGGAEAAAAPMDTSA